MYLYHSTRQKWLLNGADRLAFWQYTMPAEHEPYKNHEPLNEAMANHPGMHVYCIFFFHGEKAGLDRAKSVGLGHVLLRVDSNSMHLNQFSIAKDDKDADPYAFVWYRADSTSPVPLGRKAIHPDWGIPLSEIDICENENSDWMKLTDWLEAKQPIAPVSEPILPEPQYVYDGFDAEAYQSHSWPVTSADAIAPPKPSMGRRYQVFIENKGIEPAFSAPWRWIARWYATRITKRGGPKCHIVDTKDKTTLL